MTKSLALILLLTSLVAASAGSVTLQWGYADDTYADIEGWEIQVARQETALDDPDRRWEFAIPVDVTDIKAVLDADAGVWRDFECTLKVSSGIRWLRLRAYFLDTDGNQVFGPYSNTVSGIVTPAGILLLRLL